MNDCQKVSNSIVAGYGVCLLCRPNLAHNGGGYTQGGSEPVNFLRRAAFQFTNFLSTKHRNPTCWVAEVMGAVFGHLKHLYIFMFVNYKQKLSVNKFPVKLQNVLNLILRWRVNEECVSSLQTVSSWRVYKSFFSIKLEPVEPRNPKKPCPLNVSGCIRFQVVNEQFVQVFLSMKWKPIEPRNTIKPLNPNIKKYRFKRLFCVKLRISIKLLELSILKTCRTPKPFQGANKPPHNGGSYTQAGCFPINCPRKAAF